MSKKKTIGVLHLEDSEVIRIHVKERLSLISDSSGVTLNYVPVLHVLEINQELKKLIAQNDKTVFISDLDLGGSLSGSVAVKAIANYFDIPIIIFSASDDSAIMGVIKEAIQGRSNTAQPIVACKKGSDSIDRAFKSILESK